MKKGNQPQGFIAILSMLIIATIAMVFAISILMDGVRNASLSLNSIYHEDARINVHTCVEEVLYRIKQEDQFLQPIDYALSQDNRCTVEIQWFPPEQITPNILERLAYADVTGISHGFSRKFRYQLRVRRYDVLRPDGSLNYMNDINFVVINEVL